MQATQLPHDLEAEQALLGAVLLSERAIEHLDPEALFRPENRVVAEVMRAMHERREAIDTVTLSARLNERGELDRVGGIQALVGLSLKTPTADNAEHYARTLRRHAQRRAIIAASMQAITQASSLDVDPAEVIAAQENALLGLRSKTRGRGLRPVREAVTTAFERLETLSERKGAITGLSTGLFQLDEMTAGLQPSDLIIVAGRPSMGKTSFAVGMGQHAAIAEHAIVAAFSLEMPREQLALRMLSSEGRIEGSRLRIGHLFDEDWPRIARAAGLISESQLYIDDTGGITVSYIRAEVAKLVAALGKVGLVIVDYLQLMKGSTPGQSREQEISEVSRGLKAIAKEFNVPVIGLSQLNRSLEKREDKRPVLSDLRESGAIEQDADVIMFVYRDAVYNPDAKPNVAEIIIGKQRNGPIGTAHCAFLHEYTKFENLVADDLPAAGETGGGW